jgi:hypothetical protein
MHLNKLKILFIIKQKVGHPPDHTQPENLGVI